MKPKYSKKSKYGSRKVTVDGITFDSVREYNRYKELKLLERAGKITNLKRQVKYLLIPSLYEIEIINGKEKRRCVERACVYVAISSTLKVTSLSLRTARASRRKLTKSREN